MVPDKVNKSAGACCYRLFPVCPGKPTTQMQITAPLPRAQVAFARLGYVQDYMEFA